MKTDGLDCKLQRLPRDLGRRRERGNTEREHIQYENKNEDRNEMSKKIRGRRESERK